MTVTSKQEAWNKVNEIFPTDYEQDMASTSRAGYPIYRSTAEGHHYDYICDLGNRLEVNLDSSHQPTVNIWIEEHVQEPAMSDEDIKAGVEAMHAAKALGQHVHPLFGLEQYTRISLVIDGDCYVTDDTMLKVYNVMKTRFDGKLWIAAFGVVIEVKEMETPHLLNTVKG